MSIDWFTVGAQIINFLVLLWLMKHFLYKPVLNAIDAREERIAAELAAADAKMAEAKEERNDFQQKNEVFDKEQAERLNQAREEVNVERQRLLHEAHTAAESLKSKRAEALSSEAHLLNQSIDSRVRQEVFAITRKVMADLGGTSLEDRMIAVFVQRLAELDVQVKEELAETLKTSSQPVLLRSAFDLSEAQHQAIQNAMNAAFSAEINIQCETESDLIGGIELTANGHKIAWSINTYLTSLEKDVDALLNSNGRLEEKTGSVSDENNTLKESRALKENNVQKENSVQKESDALKESNAPKESSARKESSTSKESNAVKGSDAHGS